MISETDSENLKVIGEPLKASVMKVRCPIKNSYVDIDGNCIVLEAISKGQKDDYNITLPNEEGVWYHPVKKCTYYHNLYLSSGKGMIMDGILCRHPDATNKS